jgi:hypothetical protein
VPHDASPGDRFADGNELGFDIGPKSPGLPPRQRAGKAEVDSLHPMTLPQLLRSSFLPVAARDGDDLVDIAHLSERGTERSKQRSNAAGVSGTERCSVTIEPGVQERLDDHNAVGLALTQVIQRDRGNLGRTGRQSHQQIGESPPPHGVEIACFSTNGFDRHVGVEP